ncbi:MAG: Tryptophan synthase alpha chain [Ktedonobacterales bacterium]|jgi:tryptophan synthase alpha chain|nr:MAG: Tryptophan synthase alpha chain [Ktedonobacterales bacterium]
MPNTLRVRPIAGAFARAKAEGRVALIPYVMAGYPDVETSEALAVALGEAGADVLEIGVPFSDPLADGATIQTASHHALEQGMTLTGALALAGRVSAQVATPLVLMTYYNPIFSYGIERFCEDASAAGVAGLIVPDLPPEEAAPLATAAEQRGIALNFLVTPTSPDERVEQVARVAKGSGGFVYCVSLSGVTGARAQLPEHLAAFVARVRARTDLPLAVGFGVARAEHVAEIGRIADGAVVASALLNAVDAAPPEKRVATTVAFLRELQSSTGQETPEDTAAQ